MKIFRTSTRVAPKISLVLVDWSVRESFHVLHYLAHQSVARDSFEVILIEYYDRRAAIPADQAAEIDTWIALEMPRDTYYHKHLMYNAGILFARGELVLIGDSDAMVRPSFIQSIVDAFAADPGIVLHLDQFRNNRRDLYPFRFPSFEEITGPGCINIVDGRPAGLSDRRDPIHGRNYGACMVARRADMIAIGGADQHIDFLGHICGPYDMSFRLFNYGRREIWHQQEFLYHAWHPGAAGVDNYLGPHDGRHVSSTALAALTTGRVMPIVENAAIHALRTGADAEVATLAERLVAPADIERWRFDRIAVAARSPEVPLSRYAATPSHYNGHRIERTEAGFAATPLLAAAGAVRHAAGHRIEAGDIATLLRRIDRAARPGNRLIAASAKWTLFVEHVSAAVRRRARARA